ncbi:ABC-three component system protein [Plantactinospora sp. CA-290183]|uniref:ABC-three component system protein n=1 Tax=Plantactinospora sp. CA-290183 TaxID=3240006 RepID=UPI003D921387
MAPATHSAAPNAVGYQHQTWWALVELLRSGGDRPDASITLELHDDVAWEEDGNPTQLLQVKHHQHTHRALTDTSPDVWRTLKVWMDDAAPGDASGPQLLLVTTQTAGGGTAVAALRPETLDERAALAGLEAVAKDTTSAQTRGAREQFLALGPGDRRTFLSRIRVIDGSPHIQDVPSLVRAHLSWALPTGHEELFLAMVWRWWDEQALAMLQGRLRSLDVGVARAAIADIRDQFTSERLPTLVELLDVDVDSVAAEYRTHTFVQQMQWVAYPPRNLQKAIVDYYRVYAQTVRWLDEDLIGVAELTKFEAELVDEWEREFDWMLDTLDDDADEAAKQEAGKQMLRQLLTQTGITVRARYNEPFFVRGKRHVLADAGRIGWHPDFESRVKQLLQVAG